MSRSCEVQHPLIGTCSLGGVGGHVGDWHYASRESEVPYFTPADDARLGPYASRVTGVDRQGRTWNVGRHGTLVRLACDTHVVVERCGNVDDAVERVEEIINDTAALHDFEPHIEWDVTWGKCWACDGGDVDHHGEIVRCDTCDGDNRFPDVNDPHCGTTDREDPTS